MSHQITGVRGSVLGFATLLFLFGISASIFFLRKAEKYRLARQQFATELAVTKRLINPDEWIGDRGSIPYLQDLRQKKNEWLALRRSFMKYSVVIGFSLFMILASWVIAFSKKERIQEQLMGIHVIALICLVIGIITPMLEIAAFETDFSLDKLPIRTQIFGNEVSVTYSRTFPGDLYFFYQSKSAWQLIVTLLSQKNYVVGMSIFIFSIAFPLVKTIYTLTLTFNPDRWSRPIVKNTLLSMGKWSMADVFVVASFLGFLAFGNMQVGVPTESHVLPGLYFFIAYCLLSIGISQRINL